MLWWGLDCVGLVGETMCGAIVSFCFYLSGFDSVRLVFVWYGSLWALLHECPSRKCLPVTSQRLKLDQVWLFLETYLVALDGASSRVSRTHAFSSYQNCSI